jgi:hypothetical protein
VRNFADLPSGSMFSSTLPISSAAFSAFAAKRREFWHEADRVLEEAVQVLAGHMKARQSPLANPVPNCGPEDMP